MIEPLSKDNQLKYIKQASKSKDKFAQECMDLWQELVKARANYKCEWWGCNKGKGGYLNSHHLFSKSHQSTKFDLENGMCLCSGHHSLKTDSAHKDATFTLKATGQFPGYENRELRSVQFYIMLERKAKTPAKLDLQLEKMYLINEAKKYSELLPPEFKKKYEIN